MYLLRRFIFPILLVVLVLAVFWKLAFTDLILARGDTFVYFYPYWDARNAALMDGRLPLWSPHLFMGAPLLANIQLGALYPPNWLLTPLRAPEAVRLSILMHVAWAALGAYTLAHRAVNLTRPAAFVAGAVFALGGYVGAHVEQINQLQGLAWMPWLFVIFHEIEVYPRRKIPLLAVALALQFLSGHTQTVFISGVALTVYALLRWRPRALMWLTVGGALAVILVLPQLLPTLELISLSNRSGGLTPNEAVAFSFSPFVAGRGLLPSYDGQLFGEYVAYVGVVGLGLAVVGATGGGWRSGGRLANRAVWSVLAVVGLALALGAYNPLYWLLVELPGFNLFRVPARWLSVYALSAAVLAGFGLQHLLDERRVTRRQMVAAGVVLLALMSASFLAVRVPEEVVGSARPTWVTLMAWSVAVIILVGAGLRRGWAFVAPTVLGLVVVELFFASWVQPFNDLAPPAVYTAQRFTTSQLLAYADGEQPPGRVLSISGLFFDPGDRATLEARWRRAGLDDLAVRHAYVATKMQEIISPNLPLAWGVPSVDGFGGGLLPTGYYTTFSSLLMPPGVDEVPPDGRLREVLAREACRGACLPEQRWLNLTNTRYLVVDKVFDLWHEGVAYDTAIPLKLSAGQTSRVREVPPFQSTALDVLYTAPDDNPADTVFTLRFGDGEFAALSLNGGDGEIDGMQRARLRLETPRTPLAIEVEALADVEIRALTLVDERTGDFVQLTLGAWRRALSSDIKLYENLDMLPRAFVVHEAMVAADDDEALALMRAPTFDPARAVVLASGDELSTPDTDIESTATIVSYTDTRVEIEMNAAADGYLLLTDAYYPGWSATRNGVPVAVQRADIAFRAVRVPAGEHTVVFTFAPTFGIPLG